MKRLRKCIRIWRDEQAQAMTEYVIIIPIVLLMFAAAMQTLVIAQTVQIANYAAFAAARSYATSYSKFRRTMNPNRARQAAVTRARLAATMVMAPVSHGASSEIPRSFNQLRRQGQRSPLGRIGDTQGLIEGFVVAFTFRIKNFVVSNFNHNRDDSTFDVRFEYVLPLDVPGLSDMWNYLDPGQRRRFAEDSFSDNFEDNAAFQSGSAPPVAEFLAVMEDWQSKLMPRGLHRSMVRTYKQFVQQQASSRSTGSLANIRLYSRCAMGFEPWSGTPRRAGGNSASSGNPALQQCEDDVAVLQEAVDEQQEITDEVCDEAITASNNWATARQQRITCQQNPKNNCSAQIANENAKKNTFDSKLDDCEDEGETLGDRQEDLQDYTCNL